MQDKHFVSSAKPWSCCCYTESARYPFGALEVDAMAEVVVKADASKGYKQEIKAGSHSFISDAPSSVGGKDSGPEPHELLLGALGACTSITLQMFAQRKEWELKDVVVHVKEEVVDAPAGGGKISLITRTIKLDGNLTDEQIEHLKGIADKCPIHKLLTGRKQIVTDVTLSQHAAS